MALQAETTVARKAIIAGAAGNAMEWFDYTIYPILATVIASQFFPSEDPLASLLATFAVFAIAFFTRPIGGVVFGHFGDKIGRRNTLVASISFMALSTFLMGILPTYQQIGILAPILLVIARMLQGLSAGGEWAGSASFMVEYAPESRRGLFGGWQQCSIIGGILLGSGMGTLLTFSLSEDALNSWGWRVPFLFGIVLGAIGLYIRVGLQDTPAFRALENNEQTASAPILETLRRYYKDILVAIAFILVGAPIYYILLTYLPAYVTQTLGLPLSLALLSNSIGLLLLMILIPMVGLISDRTGRRPLMIASCVGLVVLTYPLFLLIAQGSFLSVLLAQLAFAVVVSLYIGPVAAAIVEMFPTRVRYSSLGISYNISVAVFGGTAPFIATFLISWTGNDLAPALYLIAAAVVTLIAILMMKETYRGPLRHDH